MNDNKICRICNKQIVEASFAKNSEKQYFYHVFCLEKVNLLFKIRELNILNSVDFKSLEIIFGSIMDEVPSEIIPLSNQSRSEKQPKIEITLDLDKKIQIDIISKAFNMTPGEFIENTIKNEINFVKTYLSLSKPKLNLEDYYKFEININELRKLILLEAI